MITNDPPSPKDYNETVGESDQYLLAKSTLQIVPLQTLNLSSDNPTSSGNFQFLNDSGNRWDDQMHCFEVQRGDKLSSFILTLDGYCPLVPLTFSISLSVGDTNKQHAKFKIYVNDHEEPHVIEKEDPKWAAFHTVEWQIPVDHLQVGQNKIIFRSSSHHSETPIYINNSNSVSICSSSEQNKIDIQAYYYWKSVYSALVIPGQTLSKEVTITYGMNTTQEQEYSFAETIGISANEGVDIELLAELSYSMNISFTATYSDKYFVEITKSQTTDINLSFTPQMINKCVFNFGSVA